MMGKPEELISPFLSVPGYGRVCVGEETCWGFTPCAAKLMGLGFLCLLRRSSWTLHHVRKFSVGLFPFSAGNKTHDLELRQEGIKGINLRLAL